MLFPVNIKSSSEETGVTSIYIWSQWMWLLLGVAFLLLSQWVFELPKYMSNSSPPNSKSILAVSHVAIKCRSYPIKEHFIGFSHDGAEADSSLVPPWLRSPDLGMGIMFRMDHWLGFSPLTRALSQKLRMISSRLHLFRTSGGTLSSPQVFPSTRQWFNSCLFILL